MKKFLKITINILVLSFIVAFGYRLFMNSQNNELDVGCISDYSTQLNTMNLSCDVSDIGETISSEHPLTLSLYNDDDELLFEQELVNGENTILFDFLEFNTLYQISIDGYNYIQKEYVSSNFFEHVFSTISEGTIIPELTINEIEKTDLTYGFDIELVDIDSIVISILVELYSEFDSLLYSETLSNFDNMEFEYEGLSSETNYYIKVSALFTINDLGQTANVIATKPFTTLRTLLAPSAVISNVVSDSNQLDFNLLLDDEDSTEITYLVELVNPDGTVLNSLIPVTPDISFDISMITGDYLINIKSSYTLLGVTYTDIVILTFNIYNDDYSNFFYIPTLSIVDTSEPLSDYDDYANYLYTYLNEGIEEFTIDCAAPVDCAELVNNPIYNTIPFGISNILHPYYDIKQLAYSFNDTRLKIITTTGYTDEDKILINQELNNILNTIIDDTMNDYDKILTIHDYIVNSVEYDVSCLDNPPTCDNDHTAIGIFFDYNAVCEGYAHAMDIMLRALQIPSFRLSSETHQWNVVSLDGLWYHVDPTWDDPVTHNGQDILSHDYFLITTAELNALDTTNAHDYNIDLINFVE